MFFFSRYGDRFFFTHRAMRSVGTLYPAMTRTERQAIIDSGGATLAGILCRNTPIGELRSDVLSLDGEVVSCDDVPGLPLHTFFDPEDNPVLQGEGKSVDPGPWNSIGGK